MGKVILDFILLIYNSIGFQNLGVAIIEIAVLSRIVFYPFIKQQLHYSKKMNELQPHLNALKEKHKGNQQAFAAAQMDLFKQHGVNPAAGCLPSLVQIVVLIVLYNGIYATFKENLHSTFWIWNMAKPDVYRLPGISFPVPGILVVLASLTQFIQTKMMIPSSQAPQGKAQAGTPHLEVEGGKKEEKKEFMQEFAEAQSSMIWMFPLMFLFLGTQWPSGLALYWTVSSVLAIWQQYRISGLGGLEQYIVQFRRLTLRGSSG